MSYIYFAVMFFAAGLVPELTGFGVATVSMPILSFIMPLSVAIPLVASISMLATGIVAYEARGVRGIYRRIGALVFGSAIGVPAGMVFLKVISEQILSVIFGGFLVVYALCGMFAKEGVLPANKITGSVVGALAGFFGAVFNIHGPLVGLYSVSDDLSKKQTKEMIALYMFISGIFTVAGHTIAGRMRLEVLQYVAFSLPFLAIGIYTGTQFFENLEAGWIKYGIYFFVFAAGISILI